MRKYAVIAAILLTAINFNPWLIDEAKQMTGIGAGTPCGAVTNYIHYAADDNVEEVKKYRFGGGIPAWLQDLQDVEKIDCTCSTGISDEIIRKMASVPEAVSKITEGSAVSFTITGTYQGQDVTLEGTAIALQPATSGWFIVSDGYHQLNGEQVRAPTISAVTNACT